jgi:hypothetical protein
MPDITHLPEPHVCLTALVPAGAEDRLVDWLMGHADWQVEFSVHAVAARGPLVHLDAGEERVQGFARRVECKLILPRRRVAALVTDLEQLLGEVDGGYWVMPVERFASFKRGQAEAGSAP